MYGLTLNILPMNLNQNIQSHLHDGAFPVIGSTLGISSRRPVSSLSGNGSEASSVENPTNAVGIEAGSPERIGRDDGVGPTFGADYLAFSSPGTVLITDDESDSEKDEVMARFGGMKLPYRLHRQARNAQVENGTGYFPITPDRLIASQSARLARPLDRNIAALRERRGRQIAHFQQVTGAAVKNRVTSAWGTGSSPYKDFGNGGAWSDSASSDSSVVQKEADDENPFLDDPKERPAEGKARAPVVPPNPAQPRHLERLVRVGQRDHRDVIRSLTDTDRFCMFNTGYISKAEFYKVLKRRMQPEVLLAVRKVEVVQQPNGRPRVDFWVDKRVGGDIKSALYGKSSQRRVGTLRDYKFPLYKLKQFWKPNWDEGTEQWRLDHYRSWRDRAIVSPKPREQRPEVHPTSVGTVNVNGLKSSLVELQLLLARREVAVMAVQETLWSSRDRLLKVDGYQVFDRVKEGGKVIDGKLTPEELNNFRGFRGQALLVHKAYPAYLADNFDSKYFLHVKINGFGGPGLWHVFSVYMPSGGNLRSARSKAIKQILTLCMNILKEDKNARILLAGDFNLRGKQLDRRLKSRKTGLRRVPVRGNKSTFHRVGTTWSDIDHLVASPAAMTALNHAKVQRNWGLHSDHWPLLSSVRKTSTMPEAQQEKHTRFRFDTDLVKGHGSGLVFSNRWSALPVEAITTEEELNDSVEQFTSVVNEEADQMGLKRQILGGKRFWNRKIKRLVAKAAKLRRSYEKAIKDNVETADLLHKHQLFEKARIEARLATKAHKLELEKKEAERVAKLYRTGEMKAFHKWEASLTKRSDMVDGAQPVQDKQGKLVTEPAAITERVYEYYKELNQDDPEGLSQNEAYWKGRAPERNPSTFEKLNETPKWTSALLAIRKMALGTAPGHDGIPVEVYKVLLKEECHQHLSNQGITVGDHTYVALPADKLPTDPCTPMGKALYRIIVGMWTVKRQPEFWSKVTNRSLFKSGDPTDLKNYRGISLIVLAMKIVTSMMAEMISSSMESEGMFMPEQAGFRSREEAIAQFITLAETVKRRRLQGGKTYIVFVDFLKAFDKVMHEALFEKLDAAGFRGPFLELLKNIYRTSKACVRVGNLKSQYYDMIRGTRQGCPLSPVLFILFINDFLKYVPKGVTVPGVTEGSKTLAGLFFADDLAGLADSRQGVKDFLKGVTRWSRDWKMPMGAKKCGVMLVNGSKKDYRNLRKVRFRVDGQLIDVVERYKYLGIWITTAFGDVEMTDELNHAKTLAQKVKQAVDMRRDFWASGLHPPATKLAVLESKVIPLGTYGGEWIGMRQVNTNPIQVEVNSALQLILRSASKSRLHSVRVTAWELTVRTIEERMWAARARLWRKLPSTNTWLSRLAHPDNIYRKSRGAKTWSVMTAQNIKTLLTRDPAESYDLVVAEAKEDPRSKYVSYPRGLTLEKDGNTYLQWETQEIALRLRARALDIELLTRKTESGRWYFGCSFDSTRNWGKTVALFPRLTEGLTWLHRVRTKAWWTVKSRIQRLRQKGEDASYLEEGICPHCKEPVPDASRWEELIHLYFYCAAFNEARNLHIRPYLQMLSQDLMADGNSVLTQGLQDHEALIRLLGGRIVPSRIIKYLNHDLTLVAGSEGFGADGMESDVGSATLRLFTEGWGGNPENIDPYLTASYGCVSVAAFTGIVMSAHKEALFPLRNVDIKRGFEDSSDEETPRRPRDHNTMHAQAWPPLRPVNVGRNSPDLSGGENTEDERLRCNADAGLFEDGMATIRAGNWLFPSDSED